MIAENFTRQTCLTASSGEERSLQTSEGSPLLSVFPNHCKDVRKFLFRRLASYRGEDEMPCRTVNQQISTLLVEDAL